MVLIARDLGLASAQVALLACVTCWLAAGAPTLGLVCNVARELCSFCAPIDIDLAWAEAARVLPRQGSIVGSWVWPEVVN